MSVRLFVTLILLVISSLALARGVYQAPRDFVSEVFSGAPPKPKVLWITKKLRPSVREIMGHDLNRLRVRYWREKNRSAWILEEVGKERPITVGLVIRRGTDNNSNQSRLESMRVLEYRESRGDEVRQAFFRDQFTGATLTPKQQLDRPIDGISGATLSVRALTKLVRLALFFDKQLDPQ